jgi:hypothetical protein
MYSSTLFLTSVLDGDGWSMPHPGCLPPEETQYPLYRRLGGPQGWSGQVRKISPPSGFNPLTFQPIQRVTILTELSWPTYKEMNAVNCDIHTKQVNTLCGQNAEFLALRLLVHMGTIGFYPSAMVCI